MAGIHDGVCYSVFKVLDCQKWNYLAIYKVNTQWTGKYLKIIKINILYIKIDTIQDIVLV